MSDELNKLKDDVKESLDQTAAEYSFAKEVLAKIEHLKGEAPEEALRDLHDAFQALRQTSRSEVKLYRSESRVLRVLKEIKKMVSEMDKEKIEDLMDKLVVFQKTLAKATSFLRGELKGELKDIKLDEVLAKAGKDIGTKLERDIENARKELKKLITWIQGTDGLLHQILDEEKHLEG